MPEEIALSLSGPETRILERLRSLPAGETLADQDLVAPPELTPEVVRGSLERLRAKKLVLAAETHSSQTLLTDRGRETLPKGLPERRLWEALAAQPLPAAEARAASGLDDAEFAVAVGQLKKGGFLQLGPRLERTGTLPPEGFRDEVSLASLAKGEGTIAPDAAERLVRRGLAATEHHTSRRWSPSPEGRALTLAAAGQEALGALTSVHLRGGAWKDAVLRPYDVRAQVPYLNGARTHAYLSWLREFEEILLGLGFEEGTGPLVESELINSDVLFIPQHHPARSAQDAFFVQGVDPPEPPADLLGRVAAVHEGRTVPGERKLSAGWGGKYDPAIARRLVLRSHNTPVSVRYLLRNPTPPFRMYCIGTAFRRDAIDTRHHIQFEQCEGIYGGEGVSLRDLVSLFQQLSKAAGTGEVRVKPTYFPFTEPSVEGYVKHPSLGWIEVFPGGMFRPEVLRPLGVKVPVAAWGIGVMRLAMVALGVQDIRELFSNRLDTLGESRV